MRKIVCPVCDSERFRKVVVKLPSGKDRITEFEACRRCATVFHRPGEPAAAPVSNISDFASHVPTDVSGHIAKTFPDPNTAQVEMQSAHYRHPTFGRLVLIYKRQEIRGTGKTGMKWQLVEAKRFSE
jgi:hypothetical protein